MKNSITIDLRFLLLFIIFIAIFFIKCGGKYSKDDKNIITVDDNKYEVLVYKLDTVYIETQVQIPKYTPIYVEKLIEIPTEIVTYVDVDTLAIMADYFSKYKVIDTLQLGEFGYGRLVDIITQNKIESREITWNYRFPTIYETTIVKDLPKNEFYFGLNSNIDRINLINSVGGGVLLKTKQDKIYQLNVGLANNIGGEAAPYVGGGLYWKLKFRK